MSRFEDEEIIEVDKASYIEKLNIYKLNNEQKELIYEITRYKHLRADDIHPFMESYNRRLLAITFEYYHELEPSKVLDILKEKDTRILLKKYSQSDNELVKKTADDLLILSEYDTHQFFFHIRISIHSIENNL